MYETVTAVASHSQTWLLTL